MLQDIVLISIPESTIRNIVEQAVRKVIAESQSLPTPSPDGKELITRKEAAGLAGVCLATLDNKVKSGVLTKYRTGGIVRFRRQEVLDAFSRSMLNPTPRKAKADRRGPKS